MVLSNPYWYYFETTIWLLDFFHLCSIISLLMTYGIKFTEKLKRYFNIPLEKNVKVNE